MIEDGWTCQIGKRCDVWIIKVGPLSSKMIIMADCSSHELKVLGEEAIPPQTVSCSEREHSSFDGCIDLDTKGRRWEGMIRGSVPFGYGILYNEEGEKEYEGYWKGDKPSFSAFDGATIHNYTESVIIPTMSFNWQETLSLPSFLRSLKEVEVGDHCFLSVISFCVNGLDSLEHIEVGDVSFYSYSSVSSGGVFQVVNCLNLMDIMVCYHSFFGCKTCLLGHLPSLCTLVFEACCFSAVHHFVLSSGWSFHFRSVDLDSLQMIQLNRSSCSSCVSIRFESGWFRCPLSRFAKATVTRSRIVRSCGRQRQTVHIGYEELRSVERSTLDLPSFAHLDAAGFNFRYIESIVLESTCELDSLVKTFLSWPAMVSMWGGVVSDRCKLFNLQVGEMCVSSS